MYLYISLVVVQSIYYTILKSLNEYVYAFCESKQTQWILHCY